MRFNAPIREYVCPECGWDGFKMSLKASGAGDIKWAAPRAENCAEKSFGSLRTHLWFAWNRIRYYWPQAQSRKRAGRNLAESYAAHGVAWETTDPREWSPEERT